MTYPQNYDDPHRFNPDVRYRLYDSPRNGPIVICVQDFDYLDYDGTKFLSPQAWDNEIEAESALARLLSRVQITALAVEPIQVGQLITIAVDPRTGVARAYLYDPNKA